jgi:hypothetical protein
MLSAWPEARRLELRWVAPTRVAGDPNHLAVVLDLNGGEPERRSWVSEVGDADLVVAD